MLEKISDDLLNKAKTKIFSFVYIFIGITILSSFIATVNLDNPSAKEIGKSIWYNIWIVESNIAYVLVGLVFLYFLYLFLKDIFSCFVLDKNLIIKEIWKNIRKYFFIFFRIFISIKIIAYTWFIGYFIGLIVLIPLRWI